MQDQPGVPSSRVTASNMTSHDITRLLHRVREGEQGALDELMPLVYSELRRIARAFMRQQQPGHTLQPTALVNEAFIKLFQNAEPHFVDRAHFLALMSRVMRQVLVDYARTRTTKKRGGSGHDTPERVAWTTRLGADGEARVDLLNLIELDGALDALALEDESLARLVEMRYFGGMKAEETAEALGLSVHVVRHDLRLAQAWLRRKLAG